MINSFKIETSALKCIFNLKLEIWNFGWIQISPLQLLQTVLFSWRYLRLFLAHLSRRLTRWAYSIPMVRRPSVVCHCPHFQTWISLKPVGQSWSNFMCSITGVGERLHKVLGQIGLKLWFPWQQKAPIEIMGKMMSPPFFGCFWSDPFYTSGNENMHKISDEFAFRPDRTTDYGISCPWASKKFPIDL